MFEILIEKYVSFYVQICKGTDDTMLWTYNNLVALILTIKIKLYSLSDGCKKDNIVPNFVYSVGIVSWKPTYF